MTQSAAATPAGRTSALVLLFAITSLAGFALFAIPAFIIRPFTYQSPAGIHLAMAVRQAAPLWTVLATLLAFLLALRLWPRLRSMGKSMVVVAMLLVIASAVLSRIDYFEWMFHPITSAGFETARASKLNGAEMVMAVKFGTDARAYPIREMAYHHVLNDRVGDVPIVVTY